MSPLTVRNRWRLATLYVLLTAVGVAIFLVIQQFGERLTAVNPPPTSAATTNLPAVDVVLHVLVTLTAIIALGNLLAWVFRLVGQPAVIGEVIAGILLGPSVLGAVAPDVMHWLIPGPDVDPHHQVLSALKTIAQLGIVFYMFVVGLELNIRKVGRWANAAVAISHASIVVPFVLGSALALWLYPHLSSSDVRFTSFALFMGVAMSITAFPVLARILTDQGLEKTEIGVVSLSCAAANDVTAWCLLAFVVGVARGQLGGALMVAVWSLLFILAVVLGLRPIMARVIHWIDEHGASNRSVPLLFIGVLIAALCTDVIGIHAVFGAFLLGAVIPHDSQLAQQLSHKLYDVVTILLLPSFFAITGMNTEIQLISGWQSWLMCAAIIAVATLGKFGGTLFAARLVGVDWRMSSALGVLMNTRGLMELIVLNIGLSLGVISQTLFAMMVIMALVTTVATAPLLQLLIGDQKLD